MNVSDWKHSSYLNSCQLARKRVRNWCAKSHEGDGVHCVLQVDVAAELAGDVGDDGRHEADGADGHEEAKVPVKETLRTEKTVAIQISGKTRQYNKAFRQNLQQSRFSRKN